MPKDVTFIIEDNSLDLYFDFELNFIKSECDYPEYEGTYDVIPKTYDQYLETRNYVMKDDVTVHEIPYAETSNTYGTTVTIAS